MSSLTDFVPGILYYVPHYMPTSAPEVFIPSMKFCVGANGFVRRSEEPSMTQRAREARDAYTKQCQDHHVPLNYGIMKHLMDRANLEDQQEILFPLDLAHRIHAHLQNLEAFDQLQRKVACEQMELRQTITDVYGSVFPEKQI